ncbi:MAG: hypothetical protein ACTHNU_07255 [Gaiellales bacterium]
MEESPRTEVSGIAVAAAAVPPFAFCAVVASAVPRFTTWAAFGSVATLLLAFLLVRRGRVVTATRAFGFSMLGVALMFAVYIGLVLATVTKPIH